MPFNSPLIRPTPHPRTGRPRRDQMVPLASWVRLLGALCCCLAVYAWVPQSPLQQGRRSSLRRASLWQQQQQQQQQQPWGGSSLSGSLRSTPRPPLRAVSTKLLAGTAGAGAVDATGEPTTYDVAIIGGGPAGSVMAALLAQQHKLKVVLMDPKLDDRWIPNYGVWLEEWQALEKLLGFSLEKCLMKVWQNTDLFCGGSHGIPADERLRVKRPYGRVDRVALKEELRSRALEGGAVLLPTAVDASSVVHSKEGSQLRLQDGTQVKTRFLLDCSGYQSTLVKLDGVHNPGVQIAYGIECEVDVCPYAVNAMTLMDYRTNYASSPSAEAELSREPTFMYAMPMGPTADGTKYKVFFEETSLVARPPISFDECKRRMEQRLTNLGAKVLSVEEEEFCYIPMGGAIPVRSQRVVAFGGALGLVHASTGYQICRALAASGPAAKAIAKELRKPSYNPDVAARAVYDTVWSRTTRLQRDFFVFGGEFLMVQDATNLRGFFDSFFRLPVGMWTGFLAGWPGLPNNDFHETWDRRLIFGLQFWLLSPLSLKIALAVAGVLNGGYPFIRCVTPLAELPLEFEKEAAAEAAAAAAGGVERPRQVEYEGVS